MARRFRRDAMMNWRADFRLARFPSARHDPGQGEGIVPPERTPGMSWMKATTGFVVLATVVSTTAAAQSGRLAGRAAGRPATRPAGPPVAPRVFLQQKPDFVLWDADKKIEPRVIGLAYQVERADRFQLLLKVPSHGLRGWTMSNAVISLDLAEPFFDQSIRMQPGDPFGYFMRAIARLEKGNADGALADLDEALKRDPNNVPALIRRAALSRARQQPDRAFADVDRAIAIDGREASAYVERAILWFARKDQTRAWADLDRAAELGSRDVIVPILRGQVLLERKEMTKAFDAFAEALKIDPSRHDAYLGLASVYLMRGQAKQAQAILDEAVRADPYNPEAYGNRATFYMARGDHEAVLFNLGEVIRFSPGSALAYNEQAWLLATCPVAKFRDGRKAVESATKACKLTGGKTPRYVATLAAAYAESGNFDRAAEGQERALALLGPNAPERSKYRNMLDRYRAKKPPHAISLLEELGLKSYQPPPAERSPG
jgi:tetratricopeptide (TPR) repeat protein